MKWSESGGGRREAGAGEESEEGTSPWQADSGLTAEALRAVFSWLGGEQLARAGRVCRAWRAVAALPALWRRLLRAPWPRAQLAALYGE